MWQTMPPSSPNTSQNMWVMPPSPGLKISRFSSLSIQMSTFKFVCMYMHIYNPRGTLLRQAFSLSGFFLAPSLSLSCSRFPLSLSLPPFCSLTLSRARACTYKHTYTQSLRQSICCHLFCAAQHELDELFLHELPYIVFAYINVP